MFTRPVIKLSSVLTKAVMQCEQLLNSEELVHKSFICVPSSLLGQKKGSNNYDDDDDDITRRLCQDKHI